MNYSEVIASVAAWSKRDDLNSMMSRFCAIAETRINRKLRVRQMENALAPTLIDASFKVALPAGFVGTKTLVLQGEEDSPLEPRSVDVVTAKQNAGWMAKSFAVTSDSWLFDGTGTASGTYYKAVSSLEANSTNWLADSYPDVYLWGMLSEAFQYEHAPEIAAQFEGRFSSLMAEMMGNDQRDRYTNSLTSRKV